MNQMLRNVLQELKLKMRALIGDGIAAEKIFPH